MGIGKRTTQTDTYEDTTKNSSVQSSKKKEEIVYLPEEPKFSLNDIVLPTAVKEKILDIAEYAQNSKLVFEVWGLEETHKYSKRIGINLYGAPGTGKTMAAHAIAKHLGRKILVVNYADIESKYVGDTPKNIRRVFEAAKSTNSILFFDEADAILSRRVTNMSNATDVSVNQTRSVMLMLMNEFQDFIIFATNFIENFDPAFMRRISMHVEFPLPDLDCRKKLWQMYVPQKMPTDVDFDEIAEKFDGISGSDISNAVLNAAFKAARRKFKSVSKELFFEAINDILASRAANSKNEVTMTKRFVSEEYVQAQINKNSSKEMM